MNPQTSILWRRIDQPGHEYASIDRNDQGWVISGVALFEHEDLPCRLDYIVTCDTSWSTIAARVVGVVGKEKIDVNVTSDRDGSWKLNGISCPDVQGCTDVDLNFSPSTNLLPIRRLNLAVGKKSTVDAAWLRFPSFTLERLRQTYTRIADRTYRYESADGAFVAEIQVNEFGLPVSYGDLWTALK